MFTVPQHDPAHKKYFILTLDGKVDVMVAVTICIDGLAFVHAGVLAIGAADVQLGP